MSRLTTLPGKSRTELQLERPKRGAAVVPLGLTVMFGANLLGFAWGVLVFLNNGSRDIAGFGLFMAATWVSLSVCLAGLAAGRRAD